MDKTGKQQTMRFFSRVGQSSFLWVVAAIQQEKQCFVACNRDVKKCHTLDGLHGKQVTRDVTVSDMISDDKLVEHETESLAVRR